MPAHRQHSFFPDDDERTSKRQKISHFSTPKRSSGADSARKPDSWFERELEPPTKKTRRQPDTITIDSQESNTVIDLDNRPPPNRNQRAGASLGNGRTDDRPTVLASPASDLDLKSDSDALPGMSLAQDRLSPSASRKHGTKEQPVSVDEASPSKKRQSNDQTGIRLGTNQQVNEALKKQKGSHKPATTSDKGVSSMNTMSAFAAFKKKRQEQVDDEETLRQTKDILIRSSPSDSRNKKDALLALNGRHTDRDEVEATPDTPTELRRRSRSPVSASLSYRDRSSPPLERYQRRRSKVKAAPITTESRVSFSASEDELNDPLTMQERVKKSISPAKPGTVSTREPIVDIPISGQGSPKRKASQRRESVSDIPSTYFTRKELQKKDRVRSPELSKCKAKKEVFDIYPLLRVRTKGAQLEDEQIEIHFSADKKYFMIASNGGRFIRPSNLEIARFGPAHVQKLQWSEDSCLIVVMGSADELSEGKMLFEFADGKACFQFIQSVCNMTDNAVKRLQQPS